MNSKDLTVKKLLIIIMVLFLFNTAFLGWIYYKFNSTTVGRTERAEYVINNFDNFTLGTYTVSDNMTVAQLRGMYIFGKIPAKTTLSLGLNYVCDGSGKELIERWIDENH